MGIHGNEPFSTADRPDHLGDVRRERNDPLRPFPDAGIARDLAVPTRGEEQDEKCGCTPDDAPAGRQSADSFSSSRSFGIPSRLHAASYICFAAFIAF